MNMMEKAKKYFKYGLNIFSSSYSSNIESFVKIIEKNKDKSVNSEEFKKVLSPFAFYKKSLWKLKENNTLYDSDRIWNKTFDLIAKNNLQYLTNTTPIYKTKSSSNLKYYNLYILFMKDVKKEKISNLVFEKFLNLTNFESMSMRMPYKENYVSLLSLLIESGKTEFMDMLISKFTKEKVFNWELEIYKHKDNMMRNRGKQNFIGFIMEVYLDLPFNATDKEILLKKNLEKMRDYFFNNIDNSFCITEIQQKIKDSQMKNAIGLRDFLNIKHIEILLNNDLINKQHVCKSIELIVENVKSKNITEKEIEITNKLLNLEKMNLFELYKLQLFKPKIKIIDFITSTEIFLEEESAKKVMCLYFSYFNKDDTVFKHYINLMDTEGYLKTDKDNILLYSLDLLGLRANTFIFVELLDNGVLKYIYNSVDNKPLFQEKLSKILMNNARSVAFQDKYLREINEMNFNPYEKISWNRGEFSFKDLVTEPYVSNIDKIFIKERIDTEKNKLISILDDTSEKDLPNKKRRL